MEALIQSDLIDLGNQTAERWQDIANTYRDLGLLIDSQLPDGLVYRQNTEQRFFRSRLVLIGLATFATISLFIFLFYKPIMRGFEFRWTRPKLSIIMSGLFILLSIPVLIFILMYNYTSNSDVMLAMLQEDVGKAKSASVENVDGMIQRVTGALRLLADIAALDPAFYRTEPSRNILYRVVASSPEIDAAYVSFEDGYHRVVTRIDDDRRRSDPKVPETANWHSSFIDDFAAGDSRARHRTFFDTWTIT